MLTMATYSMSILKKKFQPQKILSGMRAMVTSFAATESTIYALATGGVRCALAVIRVSGASSSTVLQQIGRFKDLPEPRKAIYRKLYDPTTKEKVVLDHGILLWFPGPRSYTGEDSCEFHVHGGPAVISSIMKSIATISGCRMAEPGEFTKRAFLNGKMDLTEVDGVADLISAETEMQRIQALNQMNGSLGKLYESWRDRIAKCLANAEAYIDFGEDENIEHDILKTTEIELRDLLIDMRFHLSDKRKGERLRNGVHIAICGQPNSGKSTLLNFLCKRDAAIVSQVPGTTRDVIETTVNFNGYPVVIADTAGIRSTPGDLIELEGMRRAVMQALKADLIILLIDPTTVCPTRKLNENLISDEIKKIFSGEFVPDVVDLLEIQNKVLVVINKVDLVEPEILQFQCKDISSSSEYPIYSEISAISCKTESGMDDFMKTLSHRVTTLCADPKSEAVYLTQERYRSHLENCSRHLKFYLESTTSDLALKTQNLKNAMNSIGFITGHFGTEDILDILFSNFCIGK